MKRKGFTLVELLAVIVILAIIALIATPIILGVIEDSRTGAAKSSMAGYIKAIENKVALSALSNTRYEDKEDYVFDEIPVDIKGTKPTGGMYSLNNGTVTSAVFCVDGFIVNYSNGISESTGEKCNENSLKLSGSVKLSAYSGNYTYPDTNTFEVTENISGGTLSCESSDEEVATCSISGTIVTVTSGQKEGSATLTIKSAETSKYDKAQASYVATTAKGTIVGISANGWSGTYNGEYHGITVSSENSIIRYGETEGTYDLETSPTYKDVGTYTVYYEIIRAGYQTIKGSKVVNITKAEVKVELAKTSGTIKFDETDSIGITVKLSNGQITAEDGQITAVAENSDIADVNVIEGYLVISGKKVGTTKITVTSEATSNCNSATTQYTVTVIKADNKLTLSSSSGNYTYPNTGTFEVIENISGGKISCTPEDSSVATCSVGSDNKTITVTPGTKEGSTTLTIKSAATDNYNETQKSYVAITAKGTIVGISANGWSGTYDGNAHGITVSCSDATIKYGTSSDSYILTSSPTYTDVGTYTVYYQVSKEGYTTITGSKTITITKANGAYASVPTAKTLTFNGSAQALVNGGSSNTGTIQYKLNNGSYGTTIPTAINPGTYTVYYRIVGDQNHNDVAEQQLTVTIKEAELSVSASGWSGTYDGNAHEITVTSNGATIKYGTSSGTYNLDSSPTYKDVGNYTVFYQVTKTGYKTVTGSKTVSITKASYTLSLSANSGDYKYPATGSFTVTKNPENGKISCSSSNSNVATCSVGSDNKTITVTSGTTAGSATLTITSAATTNYNGSQASYVAKTASGTLSVNANGWSGTYDGSSHGITVTSSGATIKYGETEGTYNLTSSPKYINAGTYKVYYQVTKTGYKTVTGSKTVSITKASYTLSLSATSGDYKYPATGSFTVTKNPENGKISCSSSNTNVSTCSVESDNKTINVKSGTTAGSATLTITSAATTNYNGSQASYVAKTASGTLSVNANGWSGTYDGSSHGITVTSSGATIKYGETEGTYNLTSSPKYINAGTYKVYYQVTREGYTTVTGSKEVTITKAQGSATLSSTSGKIDAGSGMKLIVNNATGPVSCSSSDEKIASCKWIEQDYYVSIYGNNGGTATLTIKIGESTNYSSIDISYKVEVTKKTFANVKVGDYVIMTPEVETYTVNGTGYENGTNYDYKQEIYPYKTNKWVVIKINSDKTIEMVSKDVSTSMIYFSGNTGYKKFVGVLNDIASQYKKTGYTLSARHMGYNGQTETISSLSTCTSETTTSTSLTLEAKGCGDTLYTNDTELVESALGTLKANNEYWLASRLYSCPQHTCSSTRFQRTGRFVKSDGTLSSHVLIGQVGSGGSTPEVGAYIRPIITLYSGLEATSGSGTEKEPWVLD